ncbi:fused DSP-PTPase phosphatase/NAD kinase-like protein [Aquirhabdus parva]|uniref:Protein-tyrosine-phosphatase n=1 Tax=Aquirhabdus parva TaxID=2283318 RepID=A0A345P4B0_9GAMM|nr:protein-tyrosine phosphatase family protein [Aquirhabdus parva]AXI02119.1 protein-tyrosine-phosphatase [Aquirhabdus parva]
MRIQLKQYFYPIIVVSGLFSFGCGLAGAALDGTRPQAWAIPLKLNAGLPNLYRINSSLYRSAQPTPEGFSFLNQHPSLSPTDQPIKTVLSLRAFNDNASKLPINSTLRLEQIRFKTWHPEHEDVIKFLRIATTPSLQPILVHCQHGSDRTGTMIAIYRIVVEGWTKDQAKAEMVHGDYGFHPVWQNLLQFIDELDVAAIKTEVARAGEWH